MTIDFIQIKGGYAVIADGDNTFYTLNESDARAVYELACEVNDYDADCEIEFDYGESQIDGTPVVMLIADATLDNNSFYNSELVSTRRFSDVSTAESATDFLNCLAEIHSIN